jgi:phosphoribosylanthranilate isomerase
MKSPDNITSVAALPINMMGFIFYDQSPRVVSAELASWLSSNEALFESIQKVGVFVNAPLDEVLNAVHDFQLDYVQLHGDEDSMYCNLIHNLMSNTSMRKAEIIKAFRVDDSFDFQITDAYTSSCSLFIFDTKGKDYGGTGEQFNWKVLNKYDGQTPFLLSGGIGPDDIPQLSQFTHDKMIGIDLNSRFEKQPGLKEVSLLNTFISELNTIYKSNFLK